MGGFPPSQSGQRPFLLSVWKTVVVLLPVAVLALAMLSIPALALAEALRDGDATAATSSLGAPILMTVLGLYTAYAALLLGRALIAGRPLVEIGPAGIAGPGLFGWKSFKWSEIEEVEIDGGLLHKSMILIRGFDRGPWERVLRIATLGLAGNRIGAVFFFLRDPASDVVSAFNRYCPGHLRL